MIGGPFHATEADMFEAPQVLGMCLALFEEFDSDAKSSIIFVQDRFSAIENFVRVIAVFDKGLFDFFGFIFQRNRGRCADDFIAIER